MSIFSAFLPIFFTMFVVIDPIGLVPLYIGLTSHLPLAEKKQIVNKAVAVSFIVLAFFVVLGKWILALLHIESGSFFIAGGIMLFIVSMEMLFGQPVKSKVSSKENPTDDDQSVSIAIFPLAIPMLTGPGAITAIIIFTGPAEATLWTTLMLFIAITATLAVVWIMLHASGLILKVLGKTGVSVVERIMGLLLSGLSVQFVYDGLVKLRIFEK